MKAGEEIDAGEDVTAEILPVACALTEAFLPSHCSACFVPLQNPSHGPLKHSLFAACSSHLSSPILYCSRRCRDADAGLHLRSGECQFLQALAQSSAHASSELRLALRLLHLLKNLAFLPTAGPRVAGLLGDRERFCGNDEISESVSDGGRAMGAARRMRDGNMDPGNGVDKNEVEEVVLCVVLTNAVEVQINDGMAVGLAVYGPRFSWFNHSCRPNACYRFALGWFEDGGTGESDFKVLASGEEDTLKTWISNEGKLASGSSKYGPRVIVRSIRPLRKGDEVCVTYVDPIQPKVLRHSELWSKYGFVCYCERCTAHPPPFVDLCLQETRANLIACANSFSNCNSFGSVPCRESDECLDQAMELIAEGNPEASCEKLEKMLLDGLKSLQLQTEERFLPSGFMLQPLHHISINAYIALASAYRIRANSLLTAPIDDQKNYLEAFELTRAAAAYSLMLAGATQYLFSSDSSLMASAAHFWVSAGRTLNSLLESPTWGSTFSNLGLDCLHSSHAPKEAPVPQESFDVICEGFISCILRISSEVWPFLKHGLPCLDAIESPVDFVWLMKMDTLQTAEEAQIPMFDIPTGLRPPDGEASLHGMESGKRVLGEERSGLSELATHSSLYGQYLAHICYGPHYFLDDQ